MLPPEPWIRQIRDVLVESARRHLRADVEVGVFLSGGLDSSIVAAIAAREVPALQTFAVGTAGSSDLAAARLVAEHIGSRHHEAVFDTAMAHAALEDVVAAGARSGNRTLWRHRCAAWRSWPTTGSMPDGWPAYAPERTLTRFTRT